MNKANFSKTKNSMPKVHNSTKEPTKLKSLKKYLKESKKSLSMETYLMLMKKKYPQILLNFLHKLADYLK